MSHAVNSTEFDSIPCAITECALGSLFADSLYSTRPATGLSSVALVPSSAIVNSLPSDSWTYADLEKAAYPGTRVSYLQVPGYALYTLLQYSLRDPNVTSCAPLP